MSSPVAIRAKRASAIPSALVRGMALLGAALLPVLATGAPGSPAAKVELVFLTVLTRKPVGQEVSRWAEWLERKKGEAGLQDMIWTLINSTEFLTRH